MNADYLLLLPFIGPVIGAVLTYMAGRKSRKVRDILVNAIAIAEFVLVLGLLAFYAAGNEACLVLENILGAGLTFELSGFGLIFACIAAYMWMMTTLFSRDYLSHSHNRNRYYFFLLVTLGATAGVFLAGDLFTTFVCFEMMSMASYVCVIHEETPAAMRAGGVYLAVAVIGGLTALMGIFMLYSKTGTLSYSELRPATEALFSENAAWFTISGACILVGFGAKAGMYPLHIWLPMAHPVAPAPASALLSGIITKTGIFGVAVITTRLFFADGYWGTAIVLLGIVTALLGGLLAVFSVDLKRTLACSSMSQLGFIFVGIGMMSLLGEENALAVRGVILHMFNHSNLKLVLFMAAGVVLMHLHNGNLNNVRGWGRKKPLLKVVFLFGSLGISGIPLFNGYISKTLIHESIVEYIELLEEGLGTASFAFASGESAVLFFHVIEWLFLITGGMTVAYMTKLFLALFVEKNPDPGRQAEFDAQKTYCSPLTAVVLAVSAAVLPLVGVLPYLTQNRIADFGQEFLFGESPAHAVQYFTWTNVKGGLISIGIGVLIYVVLIRLFVMKKNEAGVREYVDRWPQWLDLLTLIYEPVVMKLLPAIGAFFSRCLDWTVDGLVLLLRKTTHRQARVKKIAPPNYKLSYHTGQFWNTVAGFLNKTFLRKKPIQQDFVLSFSMRQKTRRRTLSIIASSVSFGLLMFAIGVVIVVVYLFLS